MCTRHIFCVTFADRSCFLANSIIDGSGTLHDPLGLNRPELIRLAKARKTISEFDISLLSAQGYRVLCEDRDVVLPCEWSGINFVNF